MHLYLGPVGQRDRLLHVSASYRDIMRLIEHVLAVSVGDARLSHATVSEQNDFGLHVARRLSLLIGAESLALGRLAYLECALYRLLRFFWFSTTTVATALILFLLLSH